MLIPSRIGTVVAVGDLYVANTRFAQPPRHEALSTEIVGRFFADAIAGKSSFGFLGQVEYVGNIVLHPPSQLEGADHGFEFRIVCMPRRLSGVQLLQVVKLATLRCR